jgi:hypothetical protein
MEQRGNIKFCFKTGKTATETFQLIEQAYGNSALSLVHGFLNGRVKPVGEPGYFVAS